MKRRPPIRVLAILALVGFAVWLEPTRVVWGWLRGEAFYEGRPTSYWRRAIERDLQTDPRVLFAQVFPDAATPPASWWERCRQWLRARSPETSSQRLVTWNEEAAAVLRTLADDPDEKIAGFAIDAGELRPWRLPQGYWLEVLQKHR
jgi:hypothetical protein